MINDLLLDIENYNFKFVNDGFKMTVLKYLKLLLQSLNSYDMNILHQLTLVLIEEISIRYNFNEKGYYQWTQNNGRDIISLCLTLIPYIGDDNDDNIQDLKDIIYKATDKSIPFSILSDVKLFTSPIYKVAGAEYTDPLKT